MSLQYAVVFREVRRVEVYTIEVCSLGNVRLIFLPTPVDLLQSATCVMCTLRQSWFGIDRCASRDVDTVAVQMDVTQWSKGQSLCRKHAVTPASNIAGFDPYSAAPRYRPLDRVDCLRRCAVSVSIAQIARAQAASSRSDICTPSTRLLARAIPSQTPGLHHIAGSVGKRLGLQHG